MVRTHAQRADSAMLLRLPSDMLYKIASHVVAPDLVVAAGKNLEARTALRKGTDAAERSRFGGIGLTVREAEQVLRTRYREYVDGSYLESRAAAGSTLGVGTLLCNHEAHPDAPEARDRWFDFHGGAYFFASGLLSAMIAYGADLDVQFWGGYTPLHYVAVCAPHDAVELAKLLLAAGHDIDAECMPGDAAGPTPLCWCISTGQQPTDAHYELARFLIEQGCDVLRAHDGYRNAVEGNYDYPQTLLEYLYRHPRTPANELFTAFLRGKLESLGEEVESDPGSASD